MKYEYSTYSNLIYIYVFYPIGLAIYLVLALFSFNLSTTIISLPIILCYLYYPLSKIYRISIDDKHTKYQDFFGKRIILENRNIYYTEHYFITEKGRFTSSRDTIVLKIILPNKIISVYKDEYLDYQKLRQICKEHFIYTSNAPTYYKKYTFYILMLGILIANVVFIRVLLYKQKQGIENSIAKEGYVILSAQYQNHKIERRKGGSISYIYVKFTNYTKYSFSISIEHYKNNQEIYKDSIFVKDKYLKIYISPYEYQKKIAKTQKFNFYDTFIGNKNIISVYKIEY